MLFPGRTQKEEAAILGPYSASWEFVHTCSTWHHRRKQTSKKTTETDRWHQTIDRNIHPLQIVFSVQETGLHGDPWYPNGDLRFSHMRKDQGKTKSLPAILPRLYLLWNFVLYVTAATGAGEEGNLQLDTLVPRPTGDLSSSLVNQDIQCRLKHFW